MLRPNWTWPGAVDGRCARELAAALGLPPAIGELLVRRGHDSLGRARAFLEPSLDELHDPFLLRDMDVAVERIERAIEAGEPIVVYGDYDVDGITATALLVRYLRWRNAEVGYYIPHRIEDGYGISSEGLEALAARGTRLVVTCDCGITAVREVVRANAAGLDVIVTDHHEPGDTLPPAVAVLNPKREDAGYPDRGLAAVGVAFKLCEALETAVGRGRKTVRGALDLVALGTIADLVPMTGENRILVRYGLERLGRTRNAGLRALLERTELGGAAPTAWQVGFVLAPRINAIGRMESAERGVELLLTDDPIEAERIAGQFEEVNTDRKQADRRLLAEALRLVERSYDPDEHRAIVLAGRDWHPGVIGIVASRVVERFHRPTIVISLDEDGGGRGSARSVSGFHLLEALTACRSHLDGYGGHRYAAGLAIRHASVDPFREAFQAYARETLRDDQLVPALTIDLEVPLTAIDGAFFSALGRFAPYGPGNPEPVLAIGGLCSRGYPRIVGEDHLKMTVAAEGRTLDSIGFNLGHLLREVDMNRGTLSITCRLRENAYLGRSTLQARLIDVRTGDGRD
ncbi:MAG: single-stranded-DNA-specific exonuclease RecJ [Gemmatimonadetes bacterium]|nr:single-stranded-DNA-specific exonuclease RecJ [Gemmatimonadota bacterium]